MKPNFFKRRVLLGATVGGALLFFIAGVVFWGGFNTAMEATNTLTFCTSCHEMEDNVYQEYKPTIHYANRTGVRATCSDCHVPDPWVHKVVRKIQASREVYHKVMGTVDTPEKFDEKRLHLATRVWTAMKKTDSRECRNCHNFESMNPEFQAPRARKQHLNAFETGQTCIDCHKGIAHKDVRHMLDDETLEKLEAPNPQFKRDVPDLYKAGLERVEAKEAADAEATKLAEQQQREAEAARIEQAVAAALAKQAEQSSAAVADATAADGVASSTRDFGVDWSKAGERTITVFYPGQTSMEWILNGKEHGGARPFDKGGDRCVTCHDKETADMGQKMVSGEKAETTPIPGKPGSIPVQVKASYDSDNLYLRFEWDGATHTPVPFADGGKLDPENAMKIAVMLASDDVEYADRAGCWGSCHHDARSMPHAPTTEALATAPESLEVSDGVTKYLKESRTKLELRGRNNKPLGGWDQLRSDDEMQQLLADGKFIDLLRYKSGSQQAENGYVLDQRYMNGGAGFDVSATESAGHWVVEMRRPLLSDKPGDLSLEAGTLYNIGFAIHDDYSNARFHHVSLGYKLGFDNPEAELNATKQ